MRYYFLVLVLFILLAGVLGDFFLKDPGYVFISAGHRVLETSLLLATVFVCMLAAFFYLLFIFLGKIVASKIGLTKWLESRNLQLSQSKTALGLVEFAEGNWAQAEKLLLQGTRYNAYPLINYLVAAKAADEIDAPERRNQYLQQAMKSTKNKSKLACGLTQARIQYDRGEWEACLATLSGLYKEMPRSKAILGLLVKVYEKLEDWSELFSLLADIKKQKIILPELWYDFEYKVAKNWFSLMIEHDVMKNKSAEKLKEYWAKLPSHLKKQEHFIRCYVTHLFLSGDELAASKFITTEINRHWSDQLVRLFAEHAAVIDEEKIALFERWLKDRPASVVLLIALGQLYLKAGLSDKAMVCFESANSLSLTFKACQLLGEIYLSRADYEKAAHHFRMANKEFTHVD